ncbi:hypothetical protein [Bifidobacterium callimiconis]|uniref:RND transporter n=1 Tax=Bifidobacterium callimiconis TaxID=2306973 RepID=A0A430FBP8_9BIFI|nr:hypothetical protein [Bifidobacterium callimiconis]RSX50218.1 RND transporter [Bifidobacterium callimiconis]
MRRNWGRRLAGMAIAAALGLTMMAPSAAFAASTNGEVSGQSSQSASAISGQPKSGGSGSETADESATAGNGANGATGTNNGAATNGNASTGDGDQQTSTGQNGTSGTGEADGSSDGSNTTGTTGDSANAGVSHEYQTKITFKVGDHTTTVTKKYTNSLDVTVPDDSQLGVPTGQVIVGWTSSLGVEYSADLAGAQLTGQKTITFTAILAMQLPDQSDSSAKQVQVRFVLPGSLGTVVTAKVDRGSSFADAYAAKKDEIQSRMPKNLTITGWYALLHTYKADLSDAGTVSHDTTLFAVSDLQATQTQIVFTVGKLSVFERVNTGSALADAYAAKQGAIEAIVPYGYKITGWTDENGTTYDATLSQGTATGFGMHLTATLEQTDDTPSTGIFATVTFKWTDTNGNDQQRSSRVIKGLWLLSSDIPSPKAPDGYRLDGWYTDAGVRFNRFLPVHEDATYTARWSKIDTTTGGTGTNGTGSNGTATVQPSGTSTNGANSRNTAQQWLASSQGKTPVKEQNKALATTGTAVAGLAGVAAVLLLAGTVFSMMRGRGKHKE